MAGCIRFDLQRHFLAARNIDLLKDGLIEHSLYDFAAILVESGHVIQKLEGVCRVL